MAKAFPTIVGLDELCEFANGVASLSNASYVLDQTRVTLYSCMADLTFKKIVETGTRFAAAKALHDQTNAAALAASNAAAAQAAAAEAVEDFLATL